jgi:group I intron endonuclease
MDASLFGIPNLPGIYYIINTVNGKVYVGQSINMRVRLLRHFSDLGGKKHKSNKLSRSFDKYGPDAFDCGCIELCGNATDMFKREQYWMDFFDSYRQGYNGSPRADSNKGRVVAQDVRSRISGTLKKTCRQPGCRRVHSDIAKRLSLHRFMHTPEAMEKAKAALMKWKALNPRQGVPMSAETKRLMSESAKRAILNKPDLSIIRVDRIHRDEIRQRVKIRKYVRRFEEHYRDKSGCRSALEFSRLICQLRLVQKIPKREIGRKFGAPRHSIDRWIGMAPLLCALTAPPLPNGESDSL